MRLELDIDQIKECVAIVLSMKHNLLVKESNFTYDLIDFDMHLFGIACEVEEQINKETK